MGGAIRFSPYLTILLALLAADLQQAVERSIRSELSSHHATAAGMKSRSLQVSDQSTDRRRPRELQTMGQFGR